MRRRVTRRFIQIQVAYGILVVLSGLRVNLLFAYGIWVVLRGLRVNLLFAYGILVVFSGLRVNLLFAYSILIVLSGLRVNLLCLFSDGNVPRDSTYIIKKEVTIPLSVYIPMSTCSAIGILLALGLFGFNVFHRNNPYVFTYSHLYIMPTLNSSHPLQFCLFRTY